jgi:hypothetical protein
LSLDSAHTLNRHARELTVSEAKAGIHERNTAMSETVKSTTIKLPEGLTFEDLSKVKPKVIILEETYLESLSKDVTTVALFISLVFIGVYLESNALQWMGAIIAFLSIAARASGWRKQQTMTREQALAYLYRTDSGAA